MPKPLPRFLAAALFGAIALTAPPAQAAGAVAPAVCPGQLFSQPFAGFEDLRYYVLAPGGEFNGPSSEGWTFTNGGHLASATRPSGNAGGALDLPAGATATSPPICVTLAYPAARVWLNGVSGEKGVSVAVSYAGTVSELEPKGVGKVTSPRGTWTLGEFNVAPRLAGKEEAPREVRFVFTARKGSESLLYDLYIDPRLHH
jgi:hypothetical protein